MQLALKNFKPSNFFEFHFSSRGIKWKLLLRCRKLSERRTTAQNFSKKVIFYRFHCGKIRTREKNILCRTLYTLCSVHTEGRRARLRVFLISSVVGALAVAVLRWIQLAFWVDFFVVEQTFFVFFFFLVFVSIPWPAAIKMHELSRSEEKHAFRSTYRNDFIAWSYATVCGGRLTN